MKKNIIFVVLILLVFISYIYYNFSMKNIEKKEILENNKKYEEYYEKEITGRDLASIINKVIDSNEKNNVEKNEKNTYKDNDMNSIKVDVKFKESDEIFNIEKIYNLGIDQFILNYNTMEFKCRKIDYHEKTSSIKYMYFEEI